LTDDLCSSCSMFVQTPVSKTGQINHTMYRIPCTACLPCPCTAARTIPQKVCPTIQTHTVKPNVRVCSVKSVANRRKKCSEQRKNCSKCLATRVSSGLVHLPQNITLHSCVRECRVLLLCLGCTAARASCLPCHSLILGTLFRVEGFCGTDDAHVVCQWPPPATSLFH